MTTTAERGAMKVLNAGWGVWRPLRGVAAVIFLSGCGGPTDGVQTPSNPFLDATRPGVEALEGAWTLVSLQEAEGPAARVPAGRFVADFGADADLYIQADCNVCSAAYEADDDGTVAIEGPFPCTLAYCSSAPLDAHYLKLLEEARSWSATATTLELSSGDGGTLLFRHGG